MINNLMQTINSNFNNNNKLCKIKINISSSKRILTKNLKVIYQILKIIITISKIQF